MRKLMLLVALLMVSQGFADSRFVDSASLYDCGGRVELRESGDDLHLQFEDVDYCDTLVVQTAWGKVLANYSFRKGGQRAPYSPNYTLSNSMWRELGRGKLLLKVSGGWFTRDTVSLRVNPFGGDIEKPKKCGGHPRNFTGWGLTNSCKCAYYQNGEFHHHAKPSQESKCN